MGSISKFSCFASDFFAILRVSFELTIIYLMYKSNGRHKAVKTPDCIIINYIADKVNKPHIGLY
jgi:hypothetical protein